MSWLIAIKAGFVAFLGVVAVWIGISLAAIKFLDWVLSEPEKEDNRSPDGPFLCSLSLALSAQW
jgi:hypothetical protein